MHCKKQKQNRKNILFNCTDATQSVPTWCTLYYDNKVNSILFYIQRIVLCARVTPTFSIFFVLATQTLYLYYYISLSIISAMIVFAVILLFLQLLSSPSSIVCLLLTISLYFPYYAHSYSLLTLDPSLFVSLTVLFFVTGPHCMLPVFYVSGVTWGQTNFLKPLCNQRKGQHC